MQVSRSDPTCQYILQGISFFFSIGQPHTFPVCSVVYPAVEWARCLGRIQFKFWVKCENISIMALGRGKNFRQNSFVYLYIMLRIDSALSHRVDFVEGTGVTEIDVCIFNQIYCWSTSKSLMVLINFFSHDR